MWEVVNLREAGDDGRRKRDASPLKVVHYDAFLRKAFAGEGARATTHAGGEGETPL